MRHTRLDSLLLAGAGTLTVHEVAYLPGSVRASFVDDAVAHGHLPLLWGLGGTLAVIGLARHLVRSLRGRPGDRSIDPTSLAAVTATLFVGQEMAERVLSSGSIFELTTQPTLWLGLVAVPVVATLLARLASGVAALVGRDRSSRPPAPAPVVDPAMCPGFVPATLGRLAYSVTRRGPPVRVVS